ncbi:MAG: hypothetical protein ACFN3H_04875 [Spirochaetales bacterium]
MEKYYKTYANAIINELLQLRTGDALSINTEEEDAEFAKLIASEALEITKVTVKIVILNNGKPVHVVEFEPAPPAQLPKSFAMLRLSHERKIREEGKYLDIMPEADDVLAIQKLGHLAEPVVLDRRISVPWCVAKVFDYDDTDSWAALERKIDLNIANQILVASYRSQSLENAEISEVLFRGPDTDFSVKIPQGSLFIGGRQILPSGREFMTGMDFDRLSFLADRFSAEGRFRAEIRIFGKKLTADFTFRDGLLVDRPHTAEFERLLSFDENLRRVGFISMRDNEVIINLGGALSEALGVIPRTEELLPDYFNTSLYTLKCELSKNIDIDYIDRTGIVHELAREGLFLE